MGTTDWLYSDYLRPLPEPVHGQRPPLPCRPDFHVGILFGGGIRGAVEAA